MPQNTYMHLYMNVNQHVLVHFVSCLVRSAKQAGPHSMEERIDASPLGRVRAKLAWSSGALN